MGFQVSQISEEKSKDHCVFSELCLRISEKGEAPKLPSTSQYSRTNTPHRPSTNPTYQTGMGETRDRLQ